MTGEAKTNTSTEKLPEGTPSSEAGVKQGEEEKGKEEKGKEKEVLIAGRYKTVEEAEQGVKDAETKVREMGLEKNTFKTRLETLEKERKEETKPSAEEVKAQRIKGLEGKGMELGKAWKKGPGEFYAAVEDVVRGEIKTQGVQTGAERARVTQRTQEAQRIRDEVAEEHKEDFKELTPKMAEIWDTLPPQFKQGPANKKTLEYLYQRAKAEKSLVGQGPSDADKEKMGLGQGIGSGTGPKKKELDQIDKVIAQQEKDNPLKRLEREAGKK